MMAHHPRRRREGDGPERPHKRLPPRRAGGSRADDEPLARTAHGKTPIEVPRRTILVKWPTRSRPEKFFKMLDRYRALESGKHAVRYLVSCDLDDDSMNNEDVRARLSGIPLLEVRFGHSTTKVEAVNADIAGVDGDWDILVATSDDMKPMMRNWDDIVACEMQGEDAVWFYDGHAKGVCTLSIMSRAKYEEQGYVYHPAYKSLFCDNEWTDTAKPRFIPQVVIRHEWPDRRGRDALLVRNNSYWNEDQATYYKRMKDGFPR